LILTTGPSRAGSVAAAGVEATCAQTEFDETTFNENTMIAPMCAIAELTFILISPKAARPAAGKVIVEAAIESHGDL
jgi:hypothetical protein